MRCASSGCDRPAKTMRRLSGPRSMKCPGTGSARGSADSKPGSAAVGSALSIVISLLVYLAASGDCERPGRDVLRDDRARGPPSIGANRDGSNEQIVDARVDVATDLRAELARAELGPVVSRDRSRADVRLLAHVGVADVGQVRDLRACADARVLDLHECARLRSAFEVGSGAKVTEWADSRIRPDLGVDDDGMRTDDRARPDLRFPANDRERMDLRVGLDLPVGLGP